MLNYVVPFIERLSSSEDLSYDSTIMAQIYERRRIARIVSNYLHGTGSRLDYFGSLAQLLGESEYQRLLLYLPLSDLNNASKQFRKVYLNAWYNLLNADDARENFFEGDTFEVDARPDGEVERVIKCAHLTPWLVKAKYLGYTDLKHILELNQDNEVLLRSFANTWQMLNDQKLFTEAEMHNLQNLTAQVSQRSRVDPLYVSEKRKKWLDERERGFEHEVLLTPGANLAGPFSPNIEGFTEDLEAIQSALAPEEIILVGGSSLRGYGTITSDLDLYKLRDFDDDPDTAVGSLRTTNFYFNTLWLGGNAITNLDEIAANYAEVYFKTTDRCLAIERLESDLLLYRLLHKGFVRFYAGHESAARAYADMDGDCPFYDDKYRRLATELYVKYVFIPFSA